MARKKPRIYTIAMAKGGQTKTTQALGLATILAEVGESVVVFDTDQTNTNMTKFLRKRSANIKEAGGIEVRPIKFYQVESSKELEELVRQEWNQGQNCVIDCAPTTDAATISAMLLADVILLPVRQGAIEMDALGRIDPILNAVFLSAKNAHMKPPKVYSLLADYKNSLTGREIIAELEKLHGVSFLGTVAHSEVIGRCVREGFAYWEKHPGRLRATEYRELLEKVLGRG